MAVHYLFTCLCQPYYVYMSFGIILTQFYTNFSRQGHHIDLKLFAINS